MKIDAHQHFWQYNPVKHSWINDDMKAIRKSFGPAELSKEIKPLGIEGTVAVQADETEKETSFLLGLSDKNEFIKAIVGWIDLRAGNAIERMQYWKQFEKIKGFRCIMQGQEDAAYLTNADFLDNIKKLSNYNYTYDLLVYHLQFPSLIKFVDKLPDNKMIIDHLGKPDIKNKNIKDWKSNLKILAQHPGIYCKMSGMITEADYQRWTYDDLKPYLEAAGEYFGADRICFGTDWPVCLVAGAYAQVYEVIDKFSQQLNKEEKEKLMGLNTMKFYGI